MKRLRDLSISDTGFVFDPYSGTTFSANASARCMLQGLVQGMSRDELICEVQSRFDTRGEDIARDIDDLVQSLRLYGLVHADQEVA